MKVILRANIKALGKMGDVVEVADGYGRNYLLPQKKAVMATLGAEKSVLDEKKAHLRREKSIIEKMQDVAAKIEALQVSIPCKVGEEGKLFGSVTGADISKILEENGFEIDKRKIKIDSSVLKELGTHNVEVKLHSEVVASLSVQIVPSED
ncbi:50S ribosomal protein L9 [PVC group bacterium (ex Bugula neritina AB1)]|nr:50S ribosomal protein L9 [PVC group bacterium (ex Bugula neritina AB1)]